jgi:hypothetical protein
MRWLTNINDHRVKGAEQRHHYSSFDPAERAREWAYHLKWISEHIIGRPKASEEYTVEQLEGFGLIGIYAEDEENGQEN